MEINDWARVGLSYFVVRAGYEKVCCELGVCGERKGMVPGATFLTFCILLENVKEIAYGMRLMCYMKCCVMGSLYHFHTIYGKSISKHYSRSVN